MLFRSSKKKQNGRCANKEKNTCAASKTIQPNRRNIHHLIAKYAETGSNRDIKDQRNSSSKERNPCKSKSSHPSAGPPTVVGVLIDPMAQGAHAETDLAALGVFGQRYLDRIYTAYHEVSPLAAGWRERVGLHSWHIIMIHAFLGRCRPNAGSSRGLFGHDGAEINPAHFQHWQKFGEWFTAGDND